jgi:hypothetical protein
LSPWTVDHPDCARATRPQSEVMVRHVTGYTRTVNMSVDCLPRARLGATALSELSVSSR